MGLLSWLIGRPAFDLQPDRIFLMRSAMLSDLAKQCRVALESHDRVLLVAHFEEAREMVSDKLSWDGITLHAHFDPLGSNELQYQFRAGVPMLVLAEQLRVIESLKSSPNNSQRNAIFIVECHPRRCHDERIEQFASAITGNVRVTYFLSLDQPPLSLFRSKSADWMFNFVFGKQPEKVVESQQFVSKRVQRKIERIVFSDMPAESAMEWCQRNLRNSS